MSTPPRRSAVALAVVAGYVDAVTFLTLFGLFTANMSGNAAFLGVQLGDAHWAVALARAVPIVVWGALVVGTVLVVDRPGVDRERALTPLLMLEAALLGVFLLVATLTTDAGDLTPRSAAFYALAVLAAIAMGIQTSALRRAGGVPIHTTFVSGMIVHFAEDAVLARHSPSSDVSARLRLHGAVVVAFVAGATAGAALLGALELWCLLVPLAVLVAVAADARRAARGGPRISERP